MAKTKNAEHCSFCRKTAKEVSKLIAGPPGIFICDSCVDICTGIMVGKDGSPSSGSSGSGDLKLDNIPVPQEIKSRLDEFIIGQGDAKRALAVAVYNHYKRLQYVQESGEDAEISIEKSNVLMVGPTGSGKTFLARVLAKTLNVPFAIADATTLTEAGYVGEDVENILLRLIQSADFDVKKAEKGIIYIDEIDKIGSTNQNRSITRDVSGAGVQQALLKMLEGTTANVPPQGGRKHPEQQYISIDTKNILFICGGTFDGLQDLVSQRIGRSVIGFSEKDTAAVKLSTEEQYDEIMAHAQVEDIVHFGMIPEMMGRLPIVCMLNSLKREDLVCILREPKNALLKQYQKLFEIEGKKISFTDGAVEYLADEALKVKTGARGLRALTEKVMQDIMYDFPSRDDITEFTITEEIAREGYKAYCENNDPAEKPKPKSKPRKKASA